jgi:hypothetical protein
MGEKLKRLDASICFSAFPPKAHIVSQAGHVRKVLSRDIAMAANWLLLFSKRQSLGKAA